MRGSYLSLVEHGVFEFSIDGLQARVFLAQRREFGVSLFVRDAVAAHPVGIDPLLECRVIQIACNVLLSRRAAAPHSAPRGGSPGGVAHILIRYSGASGGYTLVVSRC